jgi:hypothetical protein
MIQVALYILHDDEACARRAPNVDRLRAAYEGATVVSGNRPSDPHVQKLAADANIHASQASAVFKHAAALEKIASASPRGYHVVVEDDCIPQVTGAELRDLLLCAPPDADVLALAHPLPARGPPEATKEYARFDFEDHSFDLLCGAYMVARDKADKLRDAMVRSAALPPVLLLARAIARGEVTAYVAPRPAFTNGSRVGFDVSTQDSDGRLGNPQYRALAAFVDDVAAGLADRPPLSEVLAAADALDFKDHPANLALVARLLAACGHVDEARGFCARALDGFVAGHSPAALGGSSFLLHYIGLYRPKPDDAA